MDSDDRDYISVDAWFDVIWFSRLVTPLMSYWGIFSISIEIHRSPLVCMIIPSYKIHAELRIRFHFVMILRWAFLWVVSSGSYFLVSLRFLDGVASGSWTLTSSFCRDTCQIYDASLLSYSWFIGTDWIHRMPGIFPSFGYEEGHSITNLLQFSPLGREISYLLHRSLFWRYSSRWAFSGAGHSGCDCLAICYSSVDCCIEITVVTPIRSSFFWDSLVDHLIWSSRLTTRASYETHGVSFKHFRWIESYGDMLHWGIFPPIIPLQFGV